MAWRRVSLPIGYLAHRTQGSGWVLDGLGSALMKATPISGIPLEKSSGCGPGFVPFGCGNHWSVRRSRIGRCSSSAQASPMGFTHGLKSRREF